MNGGRSRSLRRRHDVRRISPHVIDSAKRNLLDNRRAGIAAVAMHEVMPGGSGRGSAGIGAIAETA